MKKIKKIKKFKKFKKRHVLKLKKKKQKLINEHISIHRRYAPSRLISPNNKPNP